MTAHPPENVYTTRSGRVLTDADIEKLADEAERGYDVEQLKPKPHPLEDEDVLVTVVLEHEPTGTRVMASVMAPADGGLDISEASRESTRKAMDELLAAIEQLGG